MNWGVLIRKNAFSSLINVHEKWADYRLLAFIFWKRNISSSPWKRCRPHINNNRSAASSGRMCVERSEASSEAARVCDLRAWVCFQHKLKLVRTAADASTNLARVLLRSSKRAVWGEVKAVLHFFATHLHVIVRFFDCNSARARKQISGGRTLKFVLQILHNFHWMSSLPVCSFKLKGGMWTWHFYKINPMGTKQAYD